MQKDLLLKDVNQQLSGKEFDNCSFYRLDEPRTYLCIHKADCWEKSFIVFQKDDEIRVMKGETYECSIEVLGRNKQQMMFTKFSFGVYRIIN